MTYFSGARTCTPNLAKVFRDKAYGMRHLNYTEARRPPLSLLGRGRFRTWRVAILPYFRCTRYGLVCSIPILRSLSDRLNASMINTVERPCLSQT